MFDKKIVLSTLTQLINSCNLISERFAGIESSDDFLNSRSGLMVLEGVISGMPLVLLKTLYPPRLLALIVLVGVISGMPCIVL